MKHALHIGADYIKPVTLNAQRQIVMTNLLALINESGVEFDTVVFVGASGALMGPEVASRLNKEMLLVRKDSDSNHSSCWAEGHGDIKRFIVVDDLIATGRTMKILFEKMAAKLPQAKGVGIFLYNDCGSDSSMAPCFFMRYDFDGNKMSYRSVIPKPVPALAKNNGESL